MESPASPSIRRRVLVLGLVAAVAGSVGAGIALARPTAKPIGRGVVVIETNLGYQNGAAAGTGIVLGSSGVVLTNNHVIRGATTIRILVAGTGRSYTAKVIGYDVTDDVALLQAQGASNLRTSSAGNSSRLAVGQAVTALGNAGGTGRLVSASGTITGLRQSITVDDEQGGAVRLAGLIETNAGLEPGDSGGPLSNAAGQVIGMDTAASTGGGYYASASSDGFAIPIATALSIATQISSGRSSATVHIGPTAMLGIEIDASYGNALIGDVLPGGPADSAGLAAGDVITAIGGRSVSTPTSITRLLLSKKPGQRVTVAFTDRFGESGKATVTLGSGPPQ